MKLSESSSVRVASTHGSHSRKRARSRCTTLNSAGACRSSSNLSSKPSRKGAENILNRAIRVIALVITLILAGFDARNPGRVAAVPADGRPQSFLERFFGLPAGFAHHLFARESVTAVVAGAVFHGLHQRVRLAHRIEDAFHHFEVRQSAASADIVDLAFPSPFDH